MASSNLNNIMKTTRPNLSTRILSKNTTEILKSCIGKLYRQMPMTFKKSLEQVKTDTFKMENRAPIAVFQMQERRYQRVNPLMIKPSLKTKASLSVKRPLTPISAAYKKLLQIPSSRLFNDRRYGPSNSSSNGSLWHRLNEKHRSTRALHFLAPNYTPKAMPDLKAAIIHRNAVSIVMPARNQHISSQLGSVPQALEVSSNIQRDLMIIDNLLKNRLKTNANIKLFDSKTNVAIKMMTVRDHCPTNHIPATRNEQSFAKSELNQQYKNFETKTHSKQLETIGKLEPQSQSQSLRITPTTLGGYSKRSAYQRTPAKSSAIRIGELPQQTTKWKTIPSQQQQQQQHVTGKETQIKPNPKKSIKTFLNPNETNFKVKDTSSSSRLLWELDNLHKPFKVNGKIAPSATYCLAKPCRSNRLNYIQITKFNNPFPSQDFN